MLRRKFLLAAPAVAMAGCAALSGQGSSVPLNQVKEYANDLVDALSGAALVYVSSANAVRTDLVKQLSDTLQQLKAQVNDVQVINSVRSAVLQIVTSAQELTPLVITVLGPAAPYVPLALAVLQAFVNSLPPPADAPANPPVQLKRAAMRFRIARMRHV